MLVICLALSTRKAAQLPYTYNSCACITGETSDEFTPDARAKATPLAVRRHCELEGCTRHAMCRR
jgi:hypothetical protein